MKHYFLPILSILFLALPTAAQVDSLKSYESSSITIRGELAKDGEAMQRINGVSINAARKTMVVRPGMKDMDLAGVNQRQLFGKVPGISIWENDGSGLQIGVASRGLSPNRSWEFNVRQNGYDISADVFGYPEAYYAPPLELIDRIEVIKGAAALQYGPQFGGLVNYQLKKGSTSSPLATELRLTGGSFGLFNGFIGLGGTKGKWTYYAAAHRRQADGWRPNSNYTTHTLYGSVQFRPNDKLTFSAEVTANNSLAKQAGGLIDSVFRANPDQSNRSRNWMELPWNVASLSMVWDPTANWRIEGKVFGLMAERNSVGFIGSAVNTDAANSEGLWSTRQVDADHYTNLGTEWRALSKWTWWGRTQHLSLGVRAYRGHTHRMQRGVGTTGADFDMSITAAGWGRDLHYYTENAAAFAEWLVQITERWSVVPGVRLEHIRSKGNGFFSTSNGGALNASNERQLLLPGIGTEYKLSPRTLLYANYSTAYRPVLMSDLTPSATTASVDPNLRDASGYNNDMGVRTSIKNWLTLDASFFMLHYTNRIGEIQRNGNPYRTNIGNSFTKGVEALVEVNTSDWWEPTSKFGCFTLFVNGTWMNAHYTRWDDPRIVDNPSATRVGKRVEYAPQNTVRTGLAWKRGAFSASVQYNYVGAVYSDADNTEKANANATIGKIPSYEVIDAAFTWQVNKWLSVNGGVNNVLNEVYFTRRSGGYPGPGVLPGMARNFVFGISMRTVKS